MYKSSYKIYKTLDFAYDVIESAVIIQWADDDRQDL